jgi:DNA repair exonuclease SbcCD ATPase subunit
MIRYRYVSVIGLLALTAVASGSAPTAQAQTRQRPDAAARGRDLLVQQQQIRRVRAVTRRIMHDRRASAEMKQRATELDAVLDRRTELFAKLESRHADFVAQHKTDLDELEDLRQRARVLDERLTTARNEVVEASAADIAALKESSARAADLAQALREAYREERRARHRR